MSSSKKLGNLKLLLILTIVFLFAVSAQLNFNFSPIRTPDSISYLYSQEQINVEPYLTNNNVLGLDTISYTGNALRPWLITLLYRTLSTDANIVIFQLLFYCLSWAFLTRELLARSGYRLRSNAFLLLLCILLAIPIELVSWVRLLLSESISISLVIIFSGAFIASFPLSLERNREQIIFNLSAFETQILCMALLSVVKPVSGLALMPLVLVSAIYNSRSKISLKNPRFVAACAISATITYVLISNSNSSEVWLEKLGMSRESLSVAYFTDHRVEHSHAFNEFMSEAGMPSCLVVPKNFELDPWYYARTFSALCPEGIAWVEYSFYRQYLQLIFSTNFGFLLAKDLAGPALQGTDYISLFQDSKPKVYADLTLFNWGLTSKKSSALAITTLALLGLAASYSRHRRTSESKLNSLTFSSLPLIFAGITSSIFSLFLMPADPGRIALPGSALIHIFFPLTCFFLSFELFNKAANKVKWGYEQRS
jgi:hypothetical protein